MSFENLEVGATEKERKVRFQHSQHKDFLPLLRKNTLSHYTL
jgi:hypothetical protein